MRTLTLMMLHPVSSYARALRPALSPRVFAPARSRLAWLPVHALIVVAATIAISTGWARGPVVLLLSAAIGVSFSGLTFLAHETLHGGIVRGRRLRHVIGWICFLPFVVSPRLWVVWHNKVHHGHTGQPDVDPDAYPTLAQYHSSRLVRFVTDHFALGHRHRAGAFSVIAGFTFQSAHVLLQAQTLGMSARARLFAIGETVLGIGVWVAVAAWVGLVPFLFVFVVPLLIANTIVMTFILTNHCLSPHTEVNDPLVNSLSVTAPRWYEWLTLGFGFHVEHHLFPAMSARHAPQVRDLLRARWPERYQSMPLGRALWVLAKTGRAYKDATMLVEPRTGQEWPTLTPRHSVVAATGQGPTVFTPAAGLLR